MTTLQLPKIYRRGEWLPESLDAKRNLIEVVWTTGARVKRMFASGEPFEEELAVTPNAVRLTRLNQGAPVLNGHRHNDVGDVIGIIENAWLKDSHGYARLKFSKRASVAPILEDIKQGILRHCSVGYIVHRFEDVSEDDTEQRVLRAVDWEPEELSIVAIAADPGAKIRSSATIFYPCLIIRNQTESETTGAINMSEITTNESLEHSEVIQEQRVTQAHHDDPILTERTRVSEIIKAVRSAQLNSEFAERLIESGASINKAREKIIAALETEEKNTNTQSQFRISSGEMDEVQIRRQGVEGALLHRFHPSSYQLTDMARPYAHLSLLELARGFIEAQGASTQGLSRMALAERAFHTTSDFPLILANVANKTLRNAYDDAPQTFKSFVRTTTVNDFKMISRVQLGDGVKLDPVSEHGEFTYGTFGEAQEHYQVATYGKIIGITRQTLINDDLDAFTRIPQLFGRAAANLESDLRNVHEITSRFASHLHVTLKYFSFQKSSN